MKQIAGTSTGILVALLGIIMVTISVGPYSAQASDSSVTFTVE